MTGNAAVDFAEDGEIDPALVTYAEGNPEDTENSVWSVTGDDAGKFDISTNGMLTFKAQPDYEMPGDVNTDNVYEVTVVAADADGNRGTRAVKVTVTNVDEDGVVTLSRTQPRVGVSVTASLTDPDGSISGLRWQWYNGAIGANTLIEDETSDTYTPVTANNGVILMVRASYTDGQGAMKSAEAATAEVADDTRNKPPVFEDQDTETDGDQSESTTREVEENTKALAGAAGETDADDDAANIDAPADNVGSAVMAEDPDPTRTR